MHAVGVTPLRSPSPRRCFLPLRPRQWRPSPKISLSRLRASDKTTQKIERLELLKSANVWDAVDVMSVAGTIGGATLVVLGYDLLFAALPIGLPIVSLYVGIRRERRRGKARDAFDDLIVDDLSKQKAAIDRIQQEITTASSAMRSMVGSRLKTFEEKLDAIEGTMMTTSKNVRQVSNGLRSLPGIMKRISELQQQTVIYAVSNEFRSLFEEWGTTQLQSIGELANRLKFVEESIQRLEGYDFETPSTGASPIDVTAALPEGDRDGASVLSNVRDVIAKEISSALKQLKNNQVDMMQSLRDVRLNPVPQADYAFLESQLERIESVLGSLPEQLSDALKADGDEADSKASTAVQFSAVSSVLKNLETAIEELKETSVKGEGTLELEVLEQKWRELKTLMHSLSDQITGVNDRMSTLLNKTQTTMEADEEDQPIVEADEETLKSETTFLEFEDTTETLVPSTPPRQNGTDDAPKWDVVDTLQEVIYDPPSARDEALRLTESEIEPEPEPSTDDFIFSPNGAPSTEAPSAQDLPSTPPEPVSKVGNVQVGLELLKKGRLSLEEDYGEAYKSLVGALEQFESVLEVDPDNVQCLGNCGNTLLALGELKLRMAQEMESSDDAGSKKALEQLREESRQFLTLAGRRFKTLLEKKSDDRRAYMNWGKALCTRAELTREPSMKMDLYDAAIAKYEQILSFDAGNVDAMFFCGVALKESSRVQLGSPMDIRNRLNQAVAYFEAVGNTSSPSQRQFDAFQMIQECRRLTGSPTLI